MVSECELKPEVTSNKPIEQELGIIRTAMDSGSTIELPHLPQYPVHISLFKDVRNSKFLREQLLAANAEFEYAFVDATTVNPDILLPIICV